MLASSSSASRFCREDWRGKEDLTGERFSFPLQTSPLPLPRLSRLSNPPLGFPSHGNLCYGIGPIGIYWNNEESGQQRHWGHISFWKAPCGIKKRKGNSPYADYQSAVSKKRRKSVQGIPTLPIFLRSFLAWSFSTLNCFKNNPLSSLTLNNRNRRKMYRRTCPSSIRSSSHRSLHRFPC